HKGSALSAGQMPVLARITHDMMTAPEFCSLLTRLQPSSTLFPYTTLFRSHLLGESFPAVRWLLPAGTDLLRKHGDEAVRVRRDRSEEHTSELQSRFELVCRLLLEKKNAPAPRRGRSGADAAAGAGRHATTA